MKKLILIIALVMLLASNALGGISLKEDGITKVTKEDGTTYIITEGTISTLPTNNINKLFFFFFSEVDHEKMDYYTLSISIACPNILG